MKPEDYIKFEDRLPDCPCLVFGEHGVYWVLNHPAMHDLSYYKEKGMIAWMPLIPPNVDYDLRDNCCLDCKFLNWHDGSRQWISCQKGCFDYYSKIFENIQLAKKCTDFELKGE